MIKDVKTVKQFGGQVIINNSLLYLEKKPSVLVGFHVNSLSWSNWNLECFFFIKALTQLTIPRQLQILNTKTITYDHNAPKKSRTTSYL